MGGRGAVRHRAQCRQPQARKAWCRGHRTRVKLINTLRGAFYDVKEILVDVVLRISLVLVYFCYSR